MEKKDVFTKILASLGTILVWFPILFPVLISLSRLFSRGDFRFDYLMPAELFPVILFAGGLLLWAAVRARSQRRLIAWSLGIAFGALVIGQMIAVLTGLASGAVQAEGLPWFAVLGSIALYSLSVIGMGIGAILLLRDLFSPPPQGSEST
jgi:hypothetical protein